jgi:hypothetical protein
MDVLFPECLTRIAMRLKGLGYDDAERYLGSAT